MKFHNSHHANALPDFKSDSGLTTTDDGGHHKIEKNMLRPTLGLLLKIVIEGREF